MSGVAGLQLRKSYVGTGGVTTTGEATLAQQTGTVTYTFVGTGESLLMTGSASLSLRKNYTTQFPGIVNLEWDAPVSNDATGYKIYYGTSPGVYDGTEAAQGASPITVGNILAITLTGLKLGIPYYFAVTATNVAGESAVSGEVSTTLRDGIFSMTGAATVTKIRSFQTVGSGAMAITGIASLRLRKIYTATGGVVTSGAAALSTQTGTVTFTHTATGVLTTSGAAAFALRKNLTNTGNAALTMTGVAGFALLKSFLASGGVVTGGTAGLKTIRNFIGSGGVTTTGLATLALTGQTTGQFLFTASGGVLTTGGVATLALRKVMTASGGLVTSGSASFKRINTLSIAGGAVLTTGAATFALRKLYTPSAGGVVTDGAGTTVFFPSTPGQFFYVGTGGVITSGTATLQLLKHFHGSGVVIITGTAIVIAPLTGDFSTITVADLIAEIATMVLEPATLDCGSLWSADEVISYINYTQKEFIRQAQMLKRSDSQSTLSGQSLYPSHPLSMQIDRITYGNVPLLETDQHFLDKDDPKWRTKSGRPRKYHLDHLPLKRFELDRKPTTSTALLNVVSTSLPSDVSLLTDRLMVPDYCAMYIKFGVLERMLSRQGEAQDLMRSEYCHNRFMFGAELFKKLMASNGN